MRKNNSHYIVQSFHLHFCPCMPATQTQKRCFFMGFQNRGLCENYTYSVTMVKVFVCLFKYDIWVLMKPESKCSGQALKISKVEVKVKEEKNHGHS